MSARAPGRGVLAPIGPPPPTGPSHKSHPASRTGGWRPDRPFHRRNGLLIVMRREPNLTARGYLEVPMRFQVPILDTFDRPYQYSWTTYDTLSAGQKSTPYGSQLLALTINTMLLTDDAAWNADEVVAWNAANDPVLWLNELKHIMGKRKGSKPQVFRLLVSQPGVWERQPLNTLATLTEISPQQVPGEQGTEYLSLGFLEWDESSTGQRRPQASQKTRTVRLAAGISLYELAKRYYHQPSAWRLIAHANGIRGVTPGSAPELAAWSTRHHKKMIRIPARGNK